MLSLGLYLDSSHSSARTNRKVNHSHQLRETNRSILPINNETEQGCMLLGLSWNGSAGDIRSYSEHSGLELVFHFHKIFHFHAFTSTWRNNPPNYLVMGDSLIHFASLLAKKLLTSFASFTNHWENYLFLKLLFIFSFLFRNIYN